MFCHSYKILLQLIRYHIYCFDISVVKIWYETFCTGVTDFFMSPGRWLGVFFLHDCSRDSFARHFSCNLSRGVTFLFRSVFPSHFDVTNGRGSHGGFLQPTLKDRILRPPAFIEDTPRKEAVKFCVFVAMGPHLLQSALPLRALTPTKCGIARLAYHRQATTTTQTS